MVEADVPIIQRYAACSKVERFAGGQADAPGATPPQSKQVFPHGQAETDWMGSETMARPWRTLCAHTSSSYQGLSEIGSRDSAESLLQRL